MNQYTTVDSALKSFFGLNRYIVNYNGHEFKLRMLDYANCRICNKPYEDRERNCLNEDELAIKNIIE